MIPHGFGIIFARVLGLHEEKSSRAACHRKAWASDKQVLCENHGRNPESLSLPVCFQGHSAEKNCHFQRNSAEKNCHRQGGRNVLLVTDAHRLEQRWGKL